MEAINLSRYEQRVANRVKLEQKLISNLKENMPRLEELLVLCERQTGLEDHFYRFYRGGYKVYFWQQISLQIVEEIKNLLPEIELDGTFLNIIKDGTTIPYESEIPIGNMIDIRHILEASFHSYYFLKLLVHYGKILESPPTNVLPRGWAAIICLYKLDF